MYIIDMKILIIVIATVVGITADQESYYSGKVLSLKTNTCHRAIHDFPILLIAFESDACPLITTAKDNNFTALIKNSAQHIEDIVKIHNLPFQIQYSRINYQKSPECFEDFNVTQTPTIKLYLKGMDSGYNL